MIRYRAVLSGPPQVDGKPKQIYSQSLEEAIRWGTDVIHTMSTEDKKISSVCIFETKEVAVKLICAAPESVTDVIIVPRKET